MDEIISDLTADAILDFLRRHREQLRAMGVIRIGLFGSFARGQQSAESDLDFLVVMEDASYRKFNKVWNFLEDSFGRKVDLGEEAFLRDEIRAAVLGDVRYVEAV